MRFTIKASLVFTTIVITTSCYGGNTRDLKLMTYNAALTSRVEQYDSRKEKIWDAVNGLDADVICLQEVWFHTDVKRALDSTKLTHPYSYSKMHSDVGILREDPSLPVSCSLASVGPFLQCLALQCSQAEDDVATLICAKEKCQIFEKLEQECITCLTTSKDVTRCYSDVGFATNIHGLLLISKLPLQKVKLERYDPDRKQFLPRAYISAEIEDIGMVTCTHKTAYFGPNYFEDLPYNSWEKQSLNESRILVQQQSEAKRAVIMGDLNSSPNGIKNIQPEMPDSYNVIIEKGYKDSYTGELGICTWCKYNTLVLDQKTLILDYILTKKIAVESAMRVLENDIAGLNFPLSDHYGVMAVIKLRGDNSDDEGNEN